MSDAAETAIIEAFLYNPFAVEPACKRRADEALESADIGSMISRLLRSGDELQAKKLVLAVGHAQAIRSEEAHDVLGTATLPTQALRRLPRSRGSYLRIAMAAGRAFRLLSAIVGTSRQIQHSRHETWAACFGGSLLEALELEPVIRDHDVLILGETGTGKEHFARAMMAATPGDESGRAAASATVNAAAIPDSLVESELFGHIKGSFTGATETRAGRIRSADGGAFFLDEVGDLPRRTQVKLLRVIETDEVFPVGSDTGHQADVRYIAATHKDLEGLTDRGEFRRDLFERLAGNIIRIAPLRERPEDIREIGLYFVQRYLSPERHQDRIQRIDDWLGSDEARSYDWPGNVRELQNALRNLILGLPPGVNSSAARHMASVSAAEGIPAAILGASAPLAAVEDWYIHRVFSRQEGNYSRSARILGIDRSTVKRRTEGSPEKDG